MEAASKACIHCNETYPIECYRWERKPNRKTERYRAGECNSCWKIRYRAYNKLPHVRIKHMVYDMRKNSRRKNLGDCTIEPQDIYDLFDSQDGKCALTGFHMTLSSSDDQELRRYAATVDRVDNERGYTLDNVWLVTMLANQIKSNVELEVFVEWCAAVTATVGDRQR